MPRLQAVMGENEMSVVRETAEKCPTSTLFECDVCLAMVPKLRRVWAAGTETMACAKCTGDSGQGSLDD